MTKEQREVRAIETLGIGFITFFVATAIDPALDTKDAFKVAAVTYGVGLTAIGNGGSSFVDFITPIRNAQIAKTVESINLGKVSGVATIDKNVWNWSSDPISISDKRFTLLRQALHF